MESEPERLPVLNFPDYDLLSAMRATRSARRARAGSVEIFHERMHAGRGGARDVRFGRTRDDRNGPALRDACLALDHGANVAGDRRPARPYSRDSAVELRNAEAPDFFLVSRFKRKHEASLPLARLSRLVISHV